MNSLSGKSEQKQQTFDKTIMLGAYNAGKV